MLQFDCIIESGKGKKKKKQFSFWVEIADKESEEPPKIDFLTDFRLSFPYYRDDNILKDQFWGRRPLKVHCIEQYVFE
jgi:hypothetical protein